MNVELLVRTRDVLLDRGHITGMEETPDGPVCLLRAFWRAGGGDELELAEALGFENDPNDLGFTAVSDLLWWHDKEATTEDVLCRLNTAIAEFEPTGVLA